MSLFLGLLACQNRGTEPIPPSTDACSQRALEVPAEPEGMICTWFSWVNGSEHAIVAGSLGAHPSSWGGVDLIPALDGRTVLVNDFLLGEVVAGRFSLLTPTNQTSCSGMTLSLDPIAPEPGSDSVLVNWCSIEGQHAIGRFVVGKDAPSVAYDWSEDVYTPVALEFGPERDLYMGVIGPRQQVLELREGQDPEPIAGAPTSIDCYSSGLTADQGDGGPALDATLCLTYQARKNGRLAAFERSLYLTQPGRRQVRRVDLDTGLIERVLGADEDVCARRRLEGEVSDEDEDRDAVDSCLSSTVRDVAVGPDGTVYVAEEAGCVVTVEPDGVLRTFAGTCGEPGYDGDGGAPADALLQTPTGVAVGPEGHVYITDAGAEVVRVVPFGAVRR